VSFKQSLSQEIMNKTEIMMKKFGLSDSQIDAQMEKERTTDQFAITRILLGYAMTCVVAFIFCLLISLIVKKSKPAFNNI